MSFDKISIIISFNSSKAYKLTFFQQLTASDNPLHYKMSSWL